MGIAFPLFIPYFGMAYRATIADPTLSLELSIWTTKLFFIDFWMFHIPGFILIGIGIYILIKYSRKDSNKISQ